MKFNKFTEFMAEKAQPMMYLIFTALVSVGLTLPMFKKIFNWD